VEIL
jgi:hypothetical protein